MDTEMMLDNVDKTTELYEAAITFAKVLAKWDGEELQTEAIAEMLNWYMTPESRATLVFQGLMNGHMPEEGGLADVTRLGKIFAVEFAHKVGPDNAQRLYHFAKLVTKLA